MSKNTGLETFIAFQARLEEEERAYNLADSCPRSFLIVGPAVRKTLARLEEEERAYRIVDTKTRGFFLSGLESK
ncbi:MAG: hypothetical protein FJ263_10195 [Planctomycetes bacterium]|nr:hypothetical protein [Planctomycetota bacterium]